MRLLSILILIPLTAACGGTVGAPAEPIPDATAVPTARATALPASVTRTIGGALVLRDDVTRNRSPTGTPCQSEPTSGYHDIREGASVVIRDGTGKVIATGAP
jgi:hypothetical protein